MRSLSPSARPSLLLAAVFLALPACAQTSGVTLQESAPAQPPLSASTRLALPGEKHQWLNPLIGTWNVEMTVFGEDGQPAVTSSDFTATRQWILGGRYLEERLEGPLGGAPSERRMVLGYNNLDLRFELATFDTFEPGQMIYRSRTDGTPAGFSVYGESTEAGTGPLPTGRKRDLRFEFVIEPQRSIERIYVTYPGDAERLFVEQVFTPTQEAAQ